jgi:ferric-dicitrate binding protein FerR (iron transport regulator)
MPTVRRSRGAVIATVTALVITLIAVTTLDTVPGTGVSKNIKTYATAAGQQAIVTLPNGAQAVLGPVTTVHVETAPADGGTMVTLQGEAVFTVAPHHRAPLTVRTQNAITRVLGTIFLVRQYATDPVARVVVTEGRVSLHGTNIRSKTNKGASVVLAAGTLGVVDDSGNVRVTPNVPADDYLAWTTGTLVFNQTPVAEIVDELGRAYGADLRLADSTLRQRAFTWSVSVTKLTLADALDALTTALSAHVVQAGDVITIVPGPLSRKSNHSDPLSSSEKQYGR